MSVEYLVSNYQLSAHVWYDLLSHLSLLNMFRAYIPIIRSSIGFI